MLIISLPALLYGILHLIGYYHPAYFWGVDQLHYYSSSTFVFFTLIIATTMAISTRTAWILKIEQVIDSRLQGYFKGPYPCRWFNVFFALLFIALAYLFRDRSHFLGDSAKWFTILEYALSESAPLEKISGHHSHLDISGFEYINVQQPLDLFIHFQVYRLGHALWNWAPADAYEWTSCLAGGIYVLVLWEIAACLNTSILRRTTVFAFLITLGSSQFFFGYGESYTLVTLALMLYVWHSLRCLQGHSALIYPTLLLLLAAALHLIALSLLPSWLYLLWHDKGRLGSFLKRPKVYLPLLVAGSLIGLYVYVEFYRLMHLPLWETGEEGKYALLSIPHFANLSNEILLLSPFGLVWGIAFLVRRTASTPACSFMGWATLGTSALIAVHYISMGGRDWDLMALPGLFYSLWGILYLESSTQREERFRRVRWAVLPMMTLHTVFWIGINSSPERAIDRLGNLLKFFPNQALHYQYYTLGHYHLNIRQDSPEKAVHYLREAMRYTPSDNEYRATFYRKNLAKALLSIGNNQEAIDVFEEAYASQPNLFQYESDTTFQCRWAMAYFRRGMDCYYAQGDSAKAFSLWQKTIDKCLQVIQVETSLFALELLGRTFEEMGDFGEAIKAYQRCIDIEQDDVRLSSQYLNLGIAYAKSGNPQKAVEACKQAMHSNPEDHEIRYFLALSYLDLGEVDSAMKEYSILKNLDQRLADSLSIRLDAFHSNPDNAQ